MTPTLLRDRFRGMGSNVVLEIAGGTLGHLSLARDRLAFLEARWSRFRPYSDISRLNAAQGEPTVVDPSTIHLLEAMVQGYTLTDGSFDPTLLAPLVHLGYRASVHDPAAVTDLPKGVQTRGFVRGLVVDVNLHTARLPPGTALDAGGIGKGLAADLVSELLVANGVAGVMVNVGGDVRVRGDGPFDGAWRVGVDAALQPDVEVMTVELRGGALGSSGALRRSWLSPEGLPAHHLLDPNSGHSLPGDFDSPVHATVIARTAVEAEVQATMAMVRGAASALPRLQQEGLGARLVYGNGQAYTNPEWDLIAGQTFGV